MSDLPRPAVPLAGLWPRPEPWARSIEAPSRSPVLLAPPVGTATFRTRGRTWVAEPDRVWELSRTEAWPWPIPGARQVVSDRTGARVEAGVRVYHVGDEGARRERWTGLEVAGRRIALVDGLVVVGERALDVLSGGERCSIGPHGELAVVGPRGLRVAPPGRTPVVALTEVDPESLRWSIDGSAVTVVGPDGPLRVGVATREVRPTAPERGVPEASCARAAAWVAGPAGRVWDLRAGAVVPGLGVALGATVAVGEAFVTVDWERHRGAWLDPAAARVTARFRLPLDEDDTVAHGLADGRDVLLWSAEGRCFRVRGARVEETSGAEEPEAPARATLETPAGPMLAEGTVVLEGRHWAWSGTGGLLGWSA